MFGDMYESEDDHNVVLSEPTTSERLHEAEERINRLTRTLQNVVTDSRWQTPPEPRPREVPQRLYPQRREFKLVKALDDISLPDVDLVRSGRAFSLLQRVGMPTYSEVISQEVTKMIESNSNAGFRNAFKNWALHPAQQACMMLVFWWYIADLKRRDYQANAIKDLVFPLFADHFVEEVMTCPQVSATYRDMVQAHWTKLCTRVVFALCHVCFPNSAYKFNNDFLTSIESNLRHWTTGHLPSELDKIRAALAEQARLERERGAAAGDLSSETTHARSRRESALSELLHASYNGPAPRSSFMANQHGVMQIDIHHVNVDKLVEAGKKALFDPFQRSPALRSYMERHGAILETDGMGLTVKEEEKVRPRSHRRLGAPLKGLHVGPDQDKIDSITYVNLTNRAVRMPDDPSASPSPSNARPDAPSALHALTTSALTDGASTSKAARSPFTATQVRPRPPDANSLPSDRILPLPSQDVVEAYKKTSKHVYNESIRERRRLNAQLRWIDNEAQEAQESPERVANITRQMIGRIKMDEPPRGEQAGPPSPSSANKAKAGGSKPTEANLAKLKRQNSSKKEMIEASRRQDDRNGQILRSVGSRKNLLGAPSLGAMSIATEDSSKSLIAGLKRKGVRVADPSGGVDPDSVVAKEVAERQQLLYTLHEVQTKAKEKKERARETLRRILHEKEEVVEGLEAIVTEPVPWPKPKDSRDLEAQYKRATNQVTPAFTHYEPPRAIRIHRSAQGVLRSLQNTSGPLAEF